MYKIWTKWYGYVGKNVKFTTHEDAYNFLVGYVGSEEEVEEMFDEGLASISKEDNPGWVA
jgi:hypothetical protein